MINGELAKLYRELEVERDKESRSQLKQRIHLSERKRARLETLWTKSTFRFLFFRVTR